MYLCHVQNIYYLHMATLYNQKEMPSEVTEKLRLKKKLKRYQSYLIVLKY